MSGLLAVEAKGGWQKTYHATSLTFRPDTGDEFTKRSSSKIHDGVVTAFSLVTDHVTDISPLRELKGLKSLICAGSGNRNGRLVDLSPLKDLQLTMLDCGGNQVSDLSPLRNMKLTVFYCYRSRVSELSPLKDMKLTQLSCYGTRVSDLSPLTGMPLRKLGCDFRPARDIAILRSLKTLEQINKKAVKEFWKEVDEKKSR